ncbi:MAG TPA: efflux RND transporter periplasmic adaptor subunit [Spongiibacteraceae bacterium]|nr:efflux RND transporter periplasmic adaptor subunit [Spongiibacteraceae bacterium]
MPIGKLKQYAHRQAGAAYCIALMGLLNLVGCSKTAPTSPPVDVAVITMVPRAATVTEDHVAQTEARNAIEIRPRVGGLLEKQNVVDGQRVRQGELLFVIDSQPYIAAQAQAEATLAQARAARDQSERDLGRVKPLLAIDAVSQQDYDAAVAKHDANRASVEAAQAAVKTAQLNLGYTSIQSPIDGVMARAQIKVGGLVTAYSTLLTTVYSIDPMYVNFSISEQRLLSMQNQLGRAPDQDSKTAPLFKLMLADGSEYAEAPKLNFIDPAVNQTTGTLAVRLEVPNPKHLLRAGQFARIVVASQQLNDAMIVPQRAVQDLQGKNYLWVIDAEHKAQNRAVEMGARVGNDWIVASGLKAGEIVVVDGVQKLKPGTPVNAQPLVEPDTAANTTSNAATKTANQTGTPP